MSLPTASDRSAFSVTYSGLSGLAAGFAADTGSSTGTSTVDSGAATMKMMSSTSITSMNGVTLISCVSEMSSSSCRRPAMAYSYSAARSSGRTPRSKSRDKRPRTLTEASPISAL